MRFARTASTCDRIEEAVGIFIRFIFAHGGLNCNRTLPPIVCNDYCNHLGTKGL